MGAAHVGGGLGGAQVSRGAAKDVKGAAAGHGRYPADGAERRGS